MKRILFSCLAATLLISSATAQTRDEKVRGDRELLKNDESWFYDDFERGLNAARSDNKPLMVVLRCIP